MSYHLGADYFEDQDSIFVSQPRKYINKLPETYKRVFNEEPPRGHKTPLDKNNHPDLDTSEIQEGDMAANNRNMSKSKGWTLQSSLLTLWMEKTRVNNQTKIDDDVNLLKTL